jgi:hypothetical protein
MSAEGGGAVCACAICGANNKIGRTNLKEISVRVCESVDGEGRCETQPTRPAALGGEAETSRGLTPRRITTRNVFDWDNSRTETSTQISSY